MLTVRLLKKPAWILAAILTVALLLKQGLVWQRTEFYQAAKLLAGEWGEQKGEFARGEAGTGPAEFCLGEDGVLYILDSGNGRIQVYNQHGRRQQEVRLPEGGPFNLLAVDEKDDIFTLDIAGEKIVRLAPAGDVLDTYPLGDGEEEKRELYTVEDIQTGEPGALYVQEAILYRYSVVYRLRRLDTRVGEWKMIHAVTIENTGGVQQEGGFPPEQKVNSFAVNRRGNIYLESKAGDRLRQLDLITRRGQAGQSSSVVLPGQEKILRIATAGVDARGRMYLHINPGAAVSLLCRVDQRPMAAPLLPDQIISLPPATQRVRVDRKGNLYLLRTGEEGVTMEKYILRSGFRRRGNQAG
ncbi:MAG: hypothetical protein ACOX8W_09695 [bacterium]